MGRNFKPLMIGAALGGLVLALPVTAPLLASPAAAQGGKAQGGIGESRTVVARAQVKAIDAATRKVTLVGPAGNSFVVHAGDQVRNFAQIKVGDTVIAKYYASLMLVLSGPGAKTPDDMSIGAAARAAKGQLPEGAIANRTIVTGTVVGIDLAAHTVSLVDPSGGLIHTVNVTNPRRQAEMKQLKVGDSITAVMTEALAVALDPA